MTGQNLDERQVVAGEKIHRAFVCDKVKSINEDKRLIDFVISTETADRFGDIVTVKGWQLQAYKKNPVVLFGHQSRVPPIGRAEKVWKTETALNATAEFMPREISAFADSIFQMYLGGYLRAVSVGFMPKAWEVLRDDDENFIGIKFTKQELLEFSAVPIPANPEALIDAKSKGIDTVPIVDWAEEVLDNWDNQEHIIKSLYSVNRNQVEDIRAKASGNKSTSLVGIGNTELLLPTKKAEQKSNGKGVEEMTKGNDSVSASLNRKAVAFANSCITRGEVNKDEEFDIEDNEFDAEDCLGFVEDSEEKSYPFIYEGEVYRKALVEIKRKAAQNNENDIFIAATRLLDRIDDEKSDDHDVDHIVSFLKSNVLPEDDIEALDITVFESGDVKSIFFENSPDKTLISPELLKGSDKSLVTLIGNEDNVCIKLVGMNDTFEYYPFGVTQKGDLVCQSYKSFVQKVKTETTPAEFGKASLTLDGTEDHSSTKADDEDDNEDEDEVIETATTDEVIEEKQKNEDEDSDVVKNLEEVLVELEEVLCNYKENKILENKKIFRKLQFLAGYMKELSLIIEPEDETTTDNDEIKSKSISLVNERSNKETGLTKDDINEYLKDTIVPQIETIVSNNLGKFLGRLPD